MREDDDNMEEPVVAYVFIEHVDDPDPWGKLTTWFDNDETVRFVGQFVGSFFAFARVEVDTFQRLQAKIAGDYWTAGVHCKWSIAVKPGVTLPKKNGTTYCALVQISTAPGNDPEVVMARLRKAFADWPDDLHLGTAVVTGDYDILLTFGAGSANDLRDAIIGRVREVSGVGKTETAFANLDGFELHRD